MTEQLFIMPLFEAQQEKMYHHDPELRNDVILKYLPFVKQIVNRIAGHLPSHVEVDELMHAAIIGLIQAVDRYDPSRDNSLKTYASFRIKGAVLSELRSCDYLSRTNRKKIKELEAAYLKIEKKSDGDVDEDAVAREIGVSFDEYHQIKAIANICFISIDEIDGCSKEEKEKYVRSLMSHSTDDPLTKTKIKELNTALSACIDRLNEKEKLVLSLYYFEEMTMKEIGRILDLTESRVCQIHSKAIFSLRSKMRKKGFID
jgi:RNA polymerase sigma factor FliA